MAYWLGQQGLIRLGSEPTNRLIQVQQSYMSSCLNIVCGLLADQLACALFVSTEKKHTSLISSLMIRCIEKKEAAIGIRQTETSTRDLGSCLAIFTQNKLPAEIIQKKSCKELVVYILHNIHWQRSAFNHCKNTKHINIFICFIP